ncbi:hypothetical protein CD120_08595 [Staphylococcus saprophyticus]|uniref:hypothetical protein n=1 Tax=Staphylococcus saprophyticus TaxID=29385 RepID=UPI000CD03C23|nr:hypothetical protein [Staphylococcus saprophyticus]MDW4124415.1 hypothetical protein [Staphylococcus saprophyticus]PNZ70296.1 hypothetical protein CD120_08595 [Staphylococcus saprophyticus]
MEEKYKIIVKDTNIIAFIYSILVGLSILFPSYDNVILVGLAVIVSTGITTWIRHQNKREFDKDLKEDLRDSILYSGLIIYLMNNIIVDSNNYITFIKIAVAIGAPFSIYHIFKKRTIKKYDELWYTA